MFLAWNLKKHKENQCFCSSRASGDPGGTVGPTTSKTAPPKSSQKPLNKLFFHERGRGERSRRDSAGKMIARTLRVFLA